MPVMVVGADTPVGEVIIGELVDPDREVRAFVSDPSCGVRFKEAGVKVALGDVSDTSHVSSACLRCHTAVWCAKQPGTAEKSPLPPTPGSCSPNGRRRSPRRGCGGLYG